MERGRGTRKSKIKKGIWERGEGRGEWGEGSGERGEGRGERGEGRGESGERTPAAKTPLRVISALR